MTAGARWTAVLRRSPSAAANEAALFGVPIAALRLKPAAATGAGAVCYSAADGLHFDNWQTEARALLRVDPTSQVEHVTGTQEHHWVVCRTDPADLATLLADLNAVNVALQDDAFGAFLLATLVGFRALDGSRFTLVYSHRRGTFYPFACRRVQRDTTLECEVFQSLRHALPMESDVSRWLPLWDSPI